MSSAEWYVRGEPSVAASELVDSEDGGLSETQEFPIMVPDVEGNSGVRGISKIIFA